MGDGRDERRIPSLDGLRAISIGLVLAAHAAGTRGAPIAAMPTGELGVRVFFTISGFLITSLLLDELARTGDLSLRRFYLRRTLRIFPAYYVYVATIVALAAAGAIALAPGDAAHALTYTSNYHPARAWWLGHAWSLAVEEQFYLLWPAVLLALGARRGLYAAAGFVVIAPALRLIDWYAAPELRAMQGESFWTVGDAIAIGATLAMIRPRLDRSARWLALSRSPAFALVPVVVVAAYLAGTRWTLPSLAVLQTIEIVGIAACLDWAMRFPDGRIGRALNWRPIAFVGVLSYSLYLWQQPFLDRHSTLPIAVFPLNLVLAFAAALASYYLVERPALALRRWLEPRVLPASRRRLGPAALATGRRAAR